MIHLLGTTWAISEDYVNRVFPRVLDVLQRGHSIDMLIQKKTMEDYLPALEALLSADIVADDLQLKVERDAATGFSVVRAAGKNIALIPVIGPLTKYGDMCSLGMQAYQAMISKVNSSSSIDGAVLIADTPGGTVDGTPEFGLAIKNSTKPIGVFADNLLASAGLWFASQADVIVGNKNNPTQIGSIGVLMALPNYQNMIDAGNAPQVKIYRASQSTEKALVNTVEQIPQSAEDKLQSQLDSLASDFISIIKEGRGDSLDTKAEGLFAGRMFDVNEAKKIGLIDSVGTLQTAINKVAELARQQQKQIASPNQGTTNANNNMKFPKLSALFGKPAKEATSASAEGQESLTTDPASMEAAEKKLADMEAENTQLKAEKEAKEKELTSLNAKVTELTAQVSTLEGEKTKLTETVATQKAELEKKPTGTPTSVISDDKKEEAQHADQGAAKKANYLTSIDQQAAEIRKQQELNSTFK